MAQPATTTNTPAVVPALLTARVYADGVPAKGLFIAFKLVPADETDKASRLAEVLREDAIEKFHTKKLKDYYARILAEYQAQRAETVADPATQYVLGITDADGYLEPVYDSSNPWCDRHARLEPDTFKFALGEKYKARFIRHPSPDLARSITRALNGQPAGRPDVDLANAKLWGAPQSFTIESSTGADGEQFRINVPAEPKYFVPLRTDDPKKWWLYAGMPHESVESVRQQVCELVDTLGMLKYPATGDNDMPYSVSRIQEEIARNRNKKGGDEAAKQRRINSLSDDIYTFHGPLQAAAARFQEHLTEANAFKPADWVQAHQPLSWASEIGSAVPATEIEEVVIPRLEQGGVIGPVTSRHLALWLENKWIKPDQHLVTIGFDPPPGIPMPVYHVLMLSRGAFAINAWGQLGKALGGAYGINSGHSYRQLMAEGGGGAIKNSIHKTGLAIDLTGGRQRTTKATWPVRFEAEFRRVKQKVTVPELQKTRDESEKALADAIDTREADRKAAALELEKAIDAKSSAGKIKTARAKLDGIDAKHKKAIDRATTARNTAQSNLDAMKEAIRHDADRLPNRWRMRFRLYGHSYADVFADAEEDRRRAREALKPAIAAWAGIPWPQTDDSPPETGGVNGNFCAFLRETYLSELPRNATDPWLREQFAPAYKFAKELLRMEPDAIVDHFFRESITQWRVNFYERDGGSDMTESWRAHEGNGDFPPWPTAKSWINLSAIGHGCQMHRISPHNMDARDKLSFAAEPEKIPPMAFPMTKYLEFEKSKAEQGDIVAAIEDITATGAEAPQFAHKGFTVNLVVPTGKNKEAETVGSVPPSGIDPLFFKEWRRTLAAIGDIKNVPAYTAARKGVYKPQGACLSVVMNELTDSRQGDLKTVLGYFKNDFGSNRFQIVESGSLLQPEIPKGTVFTGAELHKAATDALDRLTKAAAGKKPAAELSKDPKARKKKEETTAAVKTKAEDWSFLVQPIFAVDPQTEQILFLPEHVALLPARENAAHLEWWHYQHHSVKHAGTWAKLLQECGYSTNVMKVPAEGTPDPTGEPVHIGLGYRETGELNSHPWPGDDEIAERPANFDSAEEEAVVADPELVIQ